MGMFDYVWDTTLKCPYCGGQNLELQTKDYDSTLDTIYIHIPGIKKKRPICSACFWQNKDNPHPKTNLRSISVIATCYSPICDALARMRQYTKSGYIGGFGRHFFVTYKTDKNGIAITPATITEKDNDTLEEIHNQFMKKLNQDKRAKKDFDVAIKRAAGDWGLAILDWHYH